MQEMQVLKNERDQLLTEIKSVKQMIAAITIESEVNKGVWPGIHVLILITRPL